MSEGWLRGDGHLSARRPATFVDEVPPTGWRLTARDGVVYAECGGEHEPRVYRDGVRVFPDDEFDDETGRALREAETGETE